MTSSAVSFILFLLLFEFSFLMDGTLGAKTEIRKLKETIKLRRNLEGNDYRSSKWWARPSVSSHCQSRSYNEKVATYLPDEFGLGNSPCIIKCDASVCWKCTYTRHCESYNGSPNMCNVIEKCCTIVS